MEKTLFGIPVKYTKSPPSYTGNLLTRASWMVKYIMESGLFGGSQFYAIAACAARAGSNGHLDPTAVGHNSDADKTIDCGVWQWNSKWYIPELLKRGYLPKNFPSKKEDIENYFKTGKLSFEDQIKIGVKYLKDRLGTSKASSEFNRIKSVCGNDIETATICMAGLISYTDIEHVVKHRKYLEKGAAGRALYTAITGVTLPDVGDVENFDNAINMSDVITGSGYGFSSNTTSASSDRMSSNITNTPNTVFQLSSTGERSNVIKINDGRKDQFKSLRETLKSESFGMGRTMLESPEMYNSSILKSTQSAKRERT